MLISRQQPMMPRSHYACGTCGHLCVLGFTCSCHLLEPGLTNAPWLFSFVVTLALLEVAMMVLLLLSVK